MSDDKPDFKWLKRGVARANEGIAERLNSSDAIYRGDGRGGRSRDSDSSSGRRDSDSGRGDRGSGRG